MTLYEVYKNALNRLHLKEGNTSIENIVLEGINTALRILSTSASLSKATNITLQANVPFKLPLDFLSLNFLMQDNLTLSANDFKIQSDFLIIYDSTITATPISMNYNYTPAPKKKTDFDTDLGLNYMLQNAITTYACYYYVLSTGDTNIAMGYLNEFNSLVGKEEVKSNARSNKKPVV